MSTTRVQVPMEELRDFMAGKMAGWSEFGREMSESDLLKITDFAERALPRLARLAELVIKGDPMAATAIEQVAQSAQSLALSLALRNATDAREKFMRDVREVIAVLVIIGKSAIVAAI